MKSKTITRSAATGRIVPPSQAIKAPETTIRDKVPVRHQAGPTKSVVRDAGNGQFTPTSRAKTAPTRTVTEQVPVSKPKK